MVHSVVQQNEDHLSKKRKKGLTQKYMLDGQHQQEDMPMPEVLTRASCRKDWKRISAESFLMSHRRPNQSRDRPELK